MLGSAIDDNVANSIVSQLLFLQAQDSEKDIYLYINSPGGSVTLDLQFMIQFNILNQMYKQSVSVWCINGFIPISTAQKVNALHYQTRSYDSPTIRWCTRTSN